MFLGLVPKKKKLEVAALTIVSQFGVNFKMMFLVMQYPDHWLRSSFKKEIPSPANEASFVQLEAQIKFETRTYKVQLFGRVVKSVAEMNTYKCKFQSWPNHLLFNVNK